MAIATEQRSPYHVSRAAVLRAINVVESGRPREGIEMMERALSAHRATGANFQSSYNLSRLAEAHASAGNLAEGTELAMQAVSEVERTGERWWQAEAERMRGEILLRGGRARRREAEACFARALKCARRQEARLWELQAALSLATLWAAEGDDDRARSLLKPVYEAFEDTYPIDAICAAKKLLARRRTGTASPSAVRRYRRR